MLTVYLKATNFCNVGCSHCYLPEETRENKLAMSGRTIFKTAELVKGMMQLEGHDRVHFIWHGGEPLSLSPGYFEHAAADLSEAMGDVAYTSSLQTSLIPYTERWSDIIHKHFESQVGSSIDFSQRTVKNSAEAYLELWMSKVKLARSHGIKVTPSMVPTTSQVDQAESILQWFEESGFQDFNVERYSRFGGETIDWPSNAEHTRFLIGLFEGVWSRISAGKKAPMINVVNAAIQGVLLGRSGDRWGTQCQREFVVVEPDGSLNTCPDRTQHEAAFSNVSQGAEAFVASEQRRNWIRVMSLDHKKPHCGACEFNDFCRSGCPVTPNGPDDGQTECSGYKGYLSHILERVKQSKGNEQILLDYCRGEYRRRSI